MKNQLQISSSKLPAIGEYDSDLSAYMREISKFPILSAEQEYELAQSWKNNRDAAAAEKLLSSHLRMVVSVAYDFRNYGVSLQDLIASGNLGLVQAIQKFEPDKGFRFSTYAMFWVRAEMYETILSNWSIAKIGTTANQKRVFFNLGKARRALGIMDGSLSGEQFKQIAQYLDVPQSDVEKMSMRMSARDISLNAPSRSGDSDSDELISNLADTAAPVQSVMETVQSKRMRSALLREKMALLPKRDREILTARRMVESPETLEQLSKKYGVSRERVRQIEEAAFKKLQTMMLLEDKK